MPTTLPPRGLITDALIAHLRTELATKDLLVGDADRPKEAGWSGEQPGQGLFVPSVQVDTGEGVPLNKEPLGSQHSSWRLLYRLSTVGGTRSQADGKADAAREAVLSLPHGSGVEPIVPGWKVQSIGFARQAPVDRKAPTDHATFQVDDVLALDVVRSRA